MARHARPGWADETTRGLPAVRLVSAALEPAWPMRIHLVWLVWELPYVWLWMCVGAVDLAVSLAVFT